MYISFTNKETGIVETRCTDIVTDKNLKELEKRMPCFDYLYEEALKQLSEDISRKYRTEYRIKKNGSKRRIDIPDKDLMKYQKELVYIFTNKLEFLFPQSVYGYVKGRNAKDLAKIHKNQSQIIKIDIKDFFPNCTLDFIMNSITSIYPFCLIDENILLTIIKPCMIFYNGKYRLPQGAPSSPILSNIAMIPFDYQFNNFSYKYTRFADDIILSYEEVTFHSSKYNSTDALLSAILGETYNEPKISAIEEYNKLQFRAKKAINEIKYHLKKVNPNFTINEKKTKILNTKCGNVWMLGVSVGDDVKIGNKKKQRLKASLWTFLNDCKDGHYWSEKDTRHMLGILGYAKHIEPNFVINLITKYEQKTNVNFRKEIKKILCK